ncbi:hypothetical protein EV426DRAFT_722092 [Tirmania nivea]|nr:hypothetical protein EV426DRAFT_722092 [Tirmania nivea]
MVRITNVYAICAFAAIGGALFGFDINSMSGVLGTNAYKNYFNHPVGSWAPVQLSLRKLAEIRDEKERERKERLERKKSKFGSDDEFFEEMSNTDEGSEEEPTYGPWVAKGNPPGYLDSDDERELKEAGRVAAREKRDSIPDWQWREFGDFFIYHIGAFLEIGIPLAPLENV